MNISIAGFSINGNGVAGGSGVSLWQNSISNVIRNNLVFSNWDTGIQLEGSCRYNRIMSNTIFDQQGMGQNPGAQ